MHAELAVHGYKRGACWFHCIRPCEEIHFLKVELRFKQGRKAIGVLT